MRVETGHRVRIEYELKIVGGDLLESSMQGGPLEYAHGDGRLFPALEARLAGMEVGEERKGVLTAADALGDESAFPTQTVPRTELPGDVAPGAMFLARTAEGQAICLRTISIDGDSVNVRFLPSFAGHDLEYRVRVLSIDDPKAKRRETVPPPPLPGDVLD